ncbi:lipid-A-disaccharide synthase [Uliginosibacterium sp. H3]|uniref:Lipid-A-disaccharide synthase n=1 Tax=Uliginosibacterium silvisoli TaxID=3114758 RepID=A0ABU6K4C1_9RHOO|nr:lipid-A-disaccharide synthase [Uliginosibacterium sp. H3]
MRIAMVAGEASGDLLASHLMRALKVHLPDAQFVGIGGPKMEAEGFEAWWPAETLAVNGYVDALKRYRELSGIRKSLLNRLKEDKRQGNIDLFIGVDAPDFNLWLEEKVRGAGVPTVHYVSPSIWAWRGRRVFKVKRAADCVLCLFPFEPALYEKHGVNAHFVGHPLADEFPLDPDRDAARELLNIPLAAKVVAMLPGSRNGEVARMADSFVGTAKRLHEADPDLRFVVPLVTRETRNLFEQAIHRAEAHELPLRILFGHSQDAMTAADVVLVASGTATLEAALLKRPMVIAYRLANLSYRIMKRLAYLPYVGLPNILAGEFLVPEFIQDAVTPEALADGLEKWLLDREACERLIERFTAMHLELRQNHAQRAARAILPLLGMRG